MTRYTLDAGTLMIVNIVNIICKRAASRHRVTVGTEEIVLPVVTIELDIVKRPKIAKRTRGPILTIPSKHEFAV